MFGLRTSRFSDFGACEFSSELCFERFFLRLLLFSSQLIATDRWATGSLVLDDTHEQIKITRETSLRLQLDNQTIRKKIGSHTFSQTQTTHQNGALKIPSMPIDTVHKGSWGPAGGYNKSSALRREGRGEWEKWRLTKKRKPQLYVRFIFSKCFLLNYKTPNQDAKISVNIC